MFSRIYIYEMQGDSFKDAFISVKSLIHVWLRKCVLYNKHRTCSLAHIYMRCKETHSRTHSYRWNCSFLCDSENVFCIINTLFLHTEQVLSQIHECDARTYSYQWNRSFMCETWIVQVWLTHVRTHSHTHVWFMCVIWLIRMNSNYTLYRCSYSWHDSFVCVVWHMYKRDMTHWWVWHGSVTCVTRRIHMCEIRHARDIWMSHVVQINESCLTCEWVMSRIWMSHVTPMNESCQEYEWVMSHMNVWRM